MFFTKSQDSIKIDDTNLAAKTKNILLIEDDDLMASYIELTLQARGHNVHMSETIEAARELINHNKYDLIILDLNLPDGDGHGFLDWVRTRDEATPVMIATARDTLPEKLRGFSKGANDYVVKPFVMEEMTARIQALMHRR